MRAPSDRPPRPPRQSRGPRRIPRGRPALIIAVIVIIVLLTSIRGIAGFWTDYLWFHQLGFGSVFTGILGAKIALALIFAAIVFVFLLANLIVADRIAPRLALGPQDEIALRYREAVGRHGAKVRIVVALLFALILGIGQSSQWNNWLLFTHSQSFHATDPQFHRDISYYVFKLPFLQSLVSWSFGTILVITFVTAVFHYLNGGIKLQTPNPTQRVSPQVKAHISVLLGVLALVKGAGYYFQQYSLVGSTRGFVKGALYTDVHAQLPAFRLLMVISFIAFALLMVNIYLRGWTLPALGVGLWFLVSIAAGAIYPAIIQRYTVKPQENRKEQPYIQRNIAGTRAAYGLSHVTSVPFQANNALNAAAVESNANTVRNIRLWDPFPAIAPATFSQLQSIRGYYQFLDTDVDRYPLSGGLTQTLLSVRELNQANLPGGKSWVNSHLQYTHGYAAVMAPTNAVTPSGTPVFDIANIPPVNTDGAPQITKPQVYFGEQTPKFSIVDSQQAELDYDTAGAPVTSHYAGTGGVSVGSLTRRLAFALRFSDLNVLISGNVTSNSKILYIRDVPARLHKVAPFLKLDSDPYATIIDGRIVWVQDAYTTTNRYPYAQDYGNVGRLPGASGLNSSFNYVRNSVKATVDAYDGTVTLYVVDPTDPIINAWQSAFPKLFKPKSAMPTALPVHLRFPEDLFRVQTDMWGRYHLEDPQAFYQAGDAWNPAQDPGVGTQGTTATTQAQVVLPNGRIGFPTGVKEQDPFYLLMQLPNEAQQSFLLLQPMVALSQSTTSQQNLTAFMVVKGDPATYGQIQVFTMPAGQRIPAPAQIDSLIQQDTAVSKDISLLNTNGSEVLLGNVLTIPLDQSLLYVRPLYVSSKASGQALPELKRVIVVYNNNVYYENTLQEALQDAFPGLAQLTQEQNVGLGSPAGVTPPTTTPGTTPTTTVPGSPTTTVPIGNLTIAQLLQQAQQEFTAADQSLAKSPPDFAGYEQHIQRAESLIAQATRAAAGSTATTTPSGSTTITTNPSGPTTTRGPTTSTTAH